MKTNQQLIHKKNVVYSNKLYTLLTLFLFYFAGVQVQAAPYSVTAIKVSTTQSGRVTYGTAGAATYTVTLTESGNGIPSGANTALTLNWKTIPKGVTFTPVNTTNLTRNGQTISLRLTTTALTEAGTYSFTVSSSNGSKISGSASFVVSPRTLTIKANNQSKIYGTVLSFGATSYTISGLVNGDAITGVTLSSSGAAATATVSFFPYSIRPSAAVGTGLSNYTIRYSNGYLTVNRKPLTVTALNQSKIYGANLNLGTSAFTTSGLVNSDKITRVTLTSSGTPVTATVAGSPYAIIPRSAQGTGLSNYTISYTNGYLTVNKKALEITAYNQTKYFSQIFTFKGTDFMSSGLVNRDVVSSVTLVSAGAFSSATVEGSPYAIIPSAAVGTGLSNYTINYHTTGMLTVKALPGSPTAQNLIVTYDGFPHTASAVIGTNEVINWYTDATGTTLTTAPTLTNVGMATAWAEAKNPDDGVTSAERTEVRVIVIAKPASVTPFSVSKTYGESDPVLSGTVDGFLSSDNITAVYSRIPGETVLGGPYTISAVLSPSNALSNYDITYNTENFIINPKEASVVVADQTKEYGSNDPMLTGTLEGFFEPDHVTASYRREEGENVSASPYAITAVLSPSEVLGNYNITTTAGLFVITPKNASVVANNQTKVYGSEDPELTGTVEGFLEADSIRISYVRVEGETVLGGPYAINADLSHSDVFSNYSITSTPAWLNITPRDASVVVDNLSKVYGSEDPAMTCIMEGFLEEDSVSASYSREPGETVPGGPYSITATLSPTVLLSNYTITNTPGKLEITPKEASVVVDNQTKVYGSEDPELTGTLEGFLEGDNVTASYSRVAGENVLDGPYAITADIGSSEVLSNYTITNIGANLTISKLDVIVNAHPKSKTYGDFDPQLTFSSIPAVGFELPNHELISFRGFLLRTVGENAGTYAILQNNLDNSNYAITYNGEEMTIDRLAVSVKAQPKSKTYGDVDPALTFVSIPEEGTYLNNGERITFSGSLIRKIGENVGSYNIWDGTLDNRNFAIAYTPSTLSITPLPVTVSAQQKDKQFGEVDPELTFISVPAVGSSLANHELISFSGTIDRIPGENIGTYAINQNTLDNSNYSINYSGATFSIHPMGLAVIAEAKSKMYGDLDPALTFTSIPAEGTVMANGKVIKFSGSLARNPGEDVGSYHISQGSLVSSNYEITSFTGADLTITPLPVSVTTDTQTKTYGEVDPELTFVSVPAVGIQLANRDFIGFSGALSRSLGENVGTYPISQGSLANGNYAITFTGADLTIDPLAVTVTAQYKSKIFGEVDPPLTFVSSPAVGATLANNEKLSFTGSLSRASGEDVGSGMASRVSSESVGAYAITQNTLANSNYAITYRSANLVIGKLDVVVTADEKTKIWGEKDPAFTFTSNPAIGSKLANNEVVEFSGSLSRVYGEKVGYYEIGQSSLDNSNYNITFKTANLAITPVTANVNTLASEGSLKVYPNPFKDRLYFDLSWQKDADAKLEIYDITGAKLATVFNGSINGNEKYRLEYTPDNVRSGMLIYRLFIGEQIINGKIIYDQMK